MWGKGKGGTGHQVNDCIPIAYRSLSQYTFLCSLGTGVLFARAPALLRNIKSRLRGNQSCLGAWVRGHNGGTYYYRDGTPSYNHNHRRSSPVLFSLSPGGPVKTAAFLRASTRLVRC